MCRGALSRELKTRVRKMTQLSHLGEFKDKPRKRPSGTKGVRKMMNGVVWNKSRMTTHTEPLVGIRVCSLR